jgi:hypothetical protein
MVAFRRSGHSHWCEVVALLIVVCAAAGCTERKAQPSGTPATAGATTATPAADADSPPPRSRLCRRPPTAEGESCN